ncbi:DUF1684 domain-containing protein [Hymenobacter daeguensis]
MIKKIALAAAVIGIILYAISSSLDAEQTTYLRELQRFRRDKNRAFRQSPNSPLPEAQKARFDSLSYFPLGDQWGRPTGQLRRSPRPDTLAMMMSDGKMEQYLRFGIVEFEQADPTPDSPQRLTLFLRANGTDSTLFVPFTDLTNGHESYGGGRYLDVPLPANDATTIELDFNRAYNPYCAYGSSYSCPVPPAENRLSVHIRAGEKDFIH